MAMTQGTITSRMTGMWIKKKERKSDPWSGTQTGTPGWRWWRERGFRESTLRQVRTADPGIRVIACSLICTLIATIALLIFTVILILIRVTGQGVKFVVVIISFRKGGRGGYGCQCSSSSSRSQDQGDGGGIQDPDPRLHQHTIGSASSATAWAWWLQGIWGKVNVKSVLKKSKYTCRQEEARLINWLHNLFDRSIVPSLPIPDVRFVPALTSEPVNQQQQPLLFMTC